MIAAVVLLLLAVGFLLVSGASGEAAGGDVTASENTPGPESPFADAIAHAEGFYTSGSRPQRNNNPGDLIGGTPPASNYTTNTDGTYAIFDSAQDGWSALEDQLDAIRNGSSRYYNVNMTFLQMAAVYSPQGATAWAANVAGFLHASVTEGIRTYL